MTQNPNGTVKLAGGEYAKLLGIAVTIVLTIAGSLWKFSIAVTAAQARTEAQIEAIHSRLDAIERTSGRGGEWERGR